MRWFILLTLSACAGGPAGVPGPSNTPDPAPIDAMEVFAPAHPDAASPPDATAEAVAPTVRTNPGLSGFRCFTYHLPAALPEQYVEECLRTEKGCQQFRANMLELDSRLNVSECASAERAFCYEAFEPNSMTSLTRCFLRQAVCAKNRRLFIEQAPKSSVRADCELTI